MGQVAAHFGDAGGYARSLSGQTVNGVVSNMTSNNLAYGLGDYEERTAGGFVRATVSGVGVGVVSPWVTPLRQQVVSAGPDALKEGFKSAFSGGSGMVSSGSADSIRVATPKVGGE